ncbi:hypothetical protein [Candidatus Stoquefichus massiliensis]|uniref:hypothetical protein n=1 Tax=Candidatus Stoquefichus massiliensis TaxID=1470350 RepID=UPI0004B20FA8|nr:hypothetical protein [Candidatus Stoquefichus massiliensis]
MWVKGIVGMMTIVCGIVSIMKGRIPFIKTYSGVKNITLHSRIEGMAALLCGIILLVSCVINISSVVMMLLILGICILTLVLEITFKAI